MRAALIYDYLRYTRALDEYKKQEASDRVNEIYQKLISNKFHPDGSFDLYGVQDYNVWKIYNSEGQQKTTSLWLTAYVIRILLNAMLRKAISPNQALIEKSLDILKANRTPENNHIFFNEPKQKYSKNPYNDIKNSKAYTTAFILIPFLYHKKLFKSTKYDDIINKGNVFLEGMYDGLDSYPASIATYVLSIQEEANDFNKTKYRLEELESKYARTFGFKTYFTLNSHGSNEKYSQLNVLTSSYIALSYIKAKMYSKAKPIVKWLMSVRGIGYGFFENHDAAMAMEAITEFASKSLTTSNFSVNVKTSSNFNVGFNITKENAREMQYKELPTNDGFNFTVQGTGFIMIETACDNFNKSVFNNDLFAISVKTRGKDFFANVTIDLSYKQYNKNTSNEMIIMEIQLQSGLVYDESLNDEHNDHVKVSIAGNLSNFLLLFFFIY